MALLMDDLGQFYLFLHDQQVIFCLESTLLPLDVFLLGGPSSFLSLLVCPPSLFDLPSEQMFAQQSLLFLLHSLDKLPSIPTKLNLIKYAFSANSQARW